MRKIAFSSLVITAVIAASGLLACSEDPFTGECVAGTEFSDQATIIPSVSPYIMCATSTEAPGNKVYGNILLNNCGRQSLTISESSISSEGSDQVFTDLQLEKTEIAPGETSALRFTYTAIDTLEHSGEISIKSNASNDPELKIPLFVHADEPFDGGFCPPINGNDAGAADAGSEDH